MSNETLSPYSYLRVSRSLIHCAGKVGHDIWQELRDQVRQMILKDDRFKSIKTGRWALKCSADSVTVWV